jgi:hypothetical protein
VSETNLALYRTYAQPFVRALVTPPLAELMQQLHPLRLQYEFFSDANPWMTSMSEMAEQVRQNRRPAAADNPFIAMQENASRRMVAALDGWRELNEKVAERLFFGVYGSPTLQAAAGVDRASTRQLRKASSNPLHEELLRKRIAELKSRIPHGGLTEAMIRALLHVGAPRAAVDERGFEAVRRIRQTHSDMPLAEFKALVREQFNMLLLDREAALAAIPSMLPPDAETRTKAFDLIKLVLSARGDLSADDKKRLADIAGLFRADDRPREVRPLPPPSPRTGPHARAS